MPKMKAVQFLAIKFFNVLLVFVLDHRAKGPLIVICKTSLQFLQILFVNRFNLSSTAKQVS